MATGGADILANELAESLLDGENFDITLPNFEGGQFDLPAATTEGLYGPIARISNDDLTTKSLTGSGTFDALMQAFKVHLREEFQGNRITGEQYTKAYIALVEGAMANATQFLLGKDASYWNAVAAQLQARRAEVEVVTARVLLEAEKTKLQTLRYEALTAQSSYMLNKMRLATESVQYDTLKFTLDQIMPIQKTQATKQVEQITEEIAGLSARRLQTIEQTKGFTNDLELHPLRKNKLTEEVKGQTAQTTLTEKQAENVQQDINLGPQKLALLIKQVANQEAQTQYVGRQTDAIIKELELHPYKKTLIQEQAEAQRAQTMDTRSDGGAIAGSIGKQKDLYTQQITSYQRDSEMKAAKVFTDAWVTMKSLDEGLAPPTMFSNANLDTILTKLKANNGL